MKRLMRICLKYVTSEIYKRTCFNFLPKRKIDPSAPHIETSQLICLVNQVTGFCTKETLVAIGLINKKVTMKVYFMLLNENEI